MCFFKKKKKVAKPQIDSKYQIGDMVRFRHKGDICTGYIYEVYQKNDGVYYDIQIGGECPAIINSIKEETVLPPKAPVKG